MKRSAECIRQISSRISMRHYRNISLTELSDFTNLSEFYLCRSFQEAIGLPPHAYLTLIRIYQAKQLLKRGIPIAQVALDVGFCDQIHLSKR